ncbi:aspartate aminotransferase family protein [soil metagenome]
MTTIDPGSSRVFHRELDRHYPNMTRADGYRVFDDEGAEYLDAVGGGAGVVNIGYGVQEVIEAIQRQVERLPFIHNQKFTHPLQEQLAEMLIERAPTFSRVAFCQGGAEANETAIRLARSYHFERGDPNRWRLISPAQAYHGSTMATLALTGRPSLKDPYGPYLRDQLHIPPEDPRTDPDGQRGLENLERTIGEAGPDSIAAYFCEPVSAAAAPGLQAPDPFYRGLQDLADRYGFLIVFDEVITGVGRTGSFYAEERIPCRPDIITSAKGLGGGYLPIAAVLASERVYEPIAKGSRDFSHGHTFNGYPLACAASIAVLEYLKHHKLVERVRDLGPVVAEILRDALKGCDVVDEVRGQGFLLGVTYRAPDGEFLDSDLRFARRVDVAALDEGLLVYSTQPTSDGYMGDQTMLTPAFTTTEDDFVEMSQRLSRAVQRATSDAAADKPMHAIVG